MEEKHEPEESTLNLPLFSMKSPEHSGMLTPPLFTSASVPFRWEEEPGKPRPCTDIIPFSTIVESTKFLELPPRLLFQEPSPTTVLEGPYVVSKPKFTSLRFSREGRLSFDMSSESPKAKGSPERGQCKKLHKGTKGGIFGSWRYNSRAPKVSKAGKTKEINPSSVFSMDSADDEGSISKRRGSKMTRNGSSSSLSQATRSHFWTTVYAGIKQVMPWKSRKSRKGLV